ncbi:MAG: tRNA (adenosine(37)-N6)-threonylcarbamoyltransferase complex transferase subunit TsaD [Candidatus Omnitrophota bacterium]
MLVLGIETSCDETGASVVEGGKKVLSSIVASSLEFHKRYGGVVPEIAVRYHLEVINYAVKDSLKKAAVKLSDIDLMAVTYGPGLVGALLVGISFAKSLSYSSGIPLVGVNHLWAHIYSAFADKTKIEFPFIGLVVSGGHTAIVFCEDDGRFKLLGQTKDDAVGEAFDKIAKVLELGYPGGPAIERAALKGDADLINFPAAVIDEDSYDFSFSGIKTAVLYYIRKNFAGSKRLSKSVRADIAAAFQRTAIESIVIKSIGACKSKKVKTLVVGGGVSANKFLRQALARAGEENGTRVVFPSFEFSVDNGAMIAAMGYRLYKKGVKADLNLSAESNLGIE